jgi:hypothetical protein
MAQKYIRKLNKETLSLVKNDVLASFEVDEILGMSFDDFFSEVDVQNAYEEEWEPAMYKPYYLEVYNQITKNKKIKSNPSSNIPTLDQEAIDIISSHIKGKKLQDFLTGIDAIKKSLELGGWISRGSITSGKAYLRIGFDEGERAIYEPDSTYAKMLKTPFGRLLSALRSFDKFQGTNQELAEALSLLTPQELKKYPQNYILASIVLGEEVRDAVKFLNSARKLPVVTPIGLSPRVTYTLKEMNLDIDLPSIKMARIDFRLVQKKHADPKSEKYRQPMFDRFGEPVMEREYFVSWTPNIKFGMSRFSSGMRCEACGKSIPSGRFVPIEAHDKKSNHLIALWLGQDCAKNIFGVKDEGLARK